LPRKRNLAASKGSPQKGYLFFFTLLLSGLTHGFSVNPARAEQSVADPAFLYGGEIQFDVTRNGNKVGFHSVRFDQEGSSFAVRSQFQLEIRFLFLSAFRYHYESNEFWENGRLVRLNSTVDDDGDKFEIKAEYQPSGLQISGPGGGVASARPLYPTTHWNAAVINEHSVLNTLTGQINKVRIRPTSQEEIETEQGPVWATRYAYSGDLDTEVWYDADGRWVKMKFKGRDGSDIEYVCRRCQGGNEGKSDHAG